MDTAFILTEGDIQHPMQPILDPPVFAHRLADLVASFSKLLPE